MKRCIWSCLLFLLFSFISCSQDEVTTYYLIRHAEKDRTDKTNKNPNLTEVGQKRAVKWSDVLQNVKFDMVYSTNYNRTIQTATPTAEKNNLTLTMYNTDKMYSKDFQQRTTGKTVLLVGHSNTTPYFVNKILGKEKYTEIADNNNANLYIVTVTKDSKSSVLLKID